MNSATRPDFYPNADSAQNKAKRRQSNRDAAIRRRFLPVLPGQSPVKQQQQQSNRRMSNKSAGSTTGSASPGQPPAPIATIPLRTGTVQAMQPAFPVILTEMASIVEVARTMAGRRVDAVLITDAEGRGELRGIVTDKDLAFRCVAEGLEASRLRVGQIMTKDPVFVSSTAPVDEAMNLMLNGHFRHLPVVDEDKITGLLDITRVLMHIQGKIHQYWGKAQALKEAFRDFQATWQNFTVTPQVDAWFKDWEEKMVEPDLTQVMDSSKILPEIGCKTTVLEAARKMRDCRQTAVLVFDSDRELTGIFTTKDICLRVLATNELDPRSTSVVRVMTPHPDCGTEFMTVRAALDKMHTGHYLHLPVRSMSGNSVIGLVDVLELTYHTMNQLLRQQLVRPSSETIQMGHDQGGSQQGENAVVNNGPMWSQFWDSVETMDTNTVISPVKKYATEDEDADSVSVKTPSHQGSQVSQAVHMLPNSFVFKVRDPFSGTTQRFTIQTAYDEVKSPLSELLAAIAKHSGLALVVEEETTDMRAGFEGDYDTDNVDGQDVDDDDATVCQQQQPTKLHQTIKHTRMLLKQYQQRRLMKLRPSSIPQLFVSSQLQNASPSISLFMRLSYKDDENDWVSFFNDVELLDAISMAKINGWSRLVLRMELFLTDSLIPGAVVPLIPSSKDGKPILIPCFDGSEQNKSQLVDDDNDSVDLLKEHVGKPVSFSDMFFKKLSSADAGFFIGAAGWIVGAVGLGVWVANRLK